MSLREQLLQQTERARRKIVIPEGYPMAGETVYVQSMTSREKAAWEFQLTNKRGKPNRKMQKLVRESMVIACVVDEQGQPVFQPSDLEALSEVDARLISLLAEVAADMSGTSKDDLEELEGN